MNSDLMRLVRIAAYMLCFLASAFVGYWSMIPGTLGRMFPASRLGCLLEFALVLVYCVVGMWYARWKGATFCLPSLGRGFPLFPHEDPLQFFFTFTLLGFGLVIGSAFAFRGSGAYGFWTFMSNLGLLLALLFGQSIGYLLNRDVIRRV